MPESNHCELKKYAAERGITIREVLNGLIENLFSQEKNKGLNCQTKCNDFLK